MTRLQEAILSMYLTFKDVQAKYKSIVDTLPNYQENLAIFLETIPLIQTYSELQKTNSSGVTDDKKNLRKDLSVLTVDNARKLGTYAKFTNNTVLAKEININDSKLNHASDTGVRDYAQIVYDRGQTNLAALTSYDITEATQNTFGRLISSYNDSIGKPGVGRVDGTQTTQKLAAYYKKANAALENMDASVEIVRLKEPEFYAAYKNARKVIVLGNSNLSVQGLITDAANDEPVKGVTVSFKLDGATSKAKASSNGKPDLVKKTANKGGFKVKSLPSGTYQVTLKKVGYADQVVTINVNDNEKTELKVKLGRY